MKELNKIINKLDWKFIQEIYTQNNIIWDTFEDKIERIPKINDIKNELKHILEYMILNNTNYMMFDIFLIIYNNNIHSESNGDLIISIVKDIIHIQNINKLVDDITNNSTEDKINNLEAQKTYFINHEDYERAGFINKEIKKLKNE